MTDHKNRGHAALGGSSAERWVNCPGSVVLSEQAPKQEVSASMLEGTEAHEIAEQLLASFLNNKITGEPAIDVSDCSEDVKQHGINYRDFVWKELLEETITDKYYDLETPITIDESLQMWGSADFWACGYDDRGKIVAVIADYKYGKQNVEAEDNAQLAFYSVALCEELKKKNIEVDYVTAAIFQPRSFVNPKPKKTKFTAKQLLSWKKKFYKAAHAIYVKKKPAFKVGEWCGYCRAKGICTKYAAQTEITTSLKLVDVDNIQVPAIEMLSKETIAKIALNYDLVKDFLDGCFEYAMKEAKNNGLPGVKVVKSSEGRRSWIKNTPQAVDTLVHFSNLPRETFVKETLLGIGEVEKALKAAKINKDEVSNTMVVLTEKGKSTETLVPLDDPREAILGAMELLGSSPLEEI